MQAFEKIWEKYQRKLYHFVNKRVNNSAVAEDLVQDILIKVNANIETLESTEKLQGWIYQIARNTIIDYYRKNNQLEHEYTDDLTSPEPDQVEQARYEISICLSLLIQNLPDKYREAVSLSEIEGVTQKEIATRQNISLSGAKSRVQRGRIRLKEMLLACCSFELDKQNVIIGYQLKRDCKC